MDRRRPRGYRRTIVLVSGAALAAAAVLAISAITEWPSETVVTEVVVGASPQQIWDVLTDLDAYPRWNPAVERVEGELRQGADLRVEFSPLVGSGSAKVRVQILRTLRKLRVGERLFAPGILDREVEAQLVTLLDGRTRVVLSERLEGLGVGLTGLAADAEVLDRVALALKREAESR
jgi:uncharacterized protein YndB with AHSA1/START domain